MATKSSKKGVSLRQYQKPSSEKHQFSEEVKNYLFFNSSQQSSKKHYTDKNIIAVKHKVAKKCLYLFFLIYVTSIFMQSESKYDNYSIFHNRHKLDFQVRISTKQLVEFLHSKLW